MFGAAPPQPTAEELREAEVTAQQTIVGAVSTCFILYMSPYVVDYVRKLV